MPKEEGEQPYKRSRVSPFLRRNCSIRQQRQCSSVEYSMSTVDLKEWEEARCPVCMDHPHNAVLLFCSSHDKGCRPYMCDTSYRHSNCLDQLRKAFGSGSDSRSAGHAIFDDSDTISTPMNNNCEEQLASGEGANSVPLSKHTFVSCNSVEQRNLNCPLCRGQIKGWFVIEAARKFMNDKIRSCSHESCPFAGNYADLRKHARKEHPLARPQEVDPERERDWSRLQGERALDDVLSAIEERRNNRLHILISIGTRRSASTFVSMLRGVGR